MWFVTDREMLKHFCPWPTYHIEVPQRLATIIDRLEETGLTAKMQPLPTRLASEEEIGIVHTKRFIEEIRSTQNLTTEQLEDLCRQHEDIYANNDTWRLAQMAAAASIDLVEKVRSTGEHGFAAVRPPGHHAFPDAGCGFCIFNNVAIAAKHARRNGAKRVLIVDWDVHAGQGTQECIEDDEGIRLISIHRFENGTFWPNLEQSAVDNKFKNTVNVPLNGVGFTDGDYISIFEMVVLPIVHDFEPEVILVSCGFDAALGDPEGYMKLTPVGYATLTRMLQNTGVPLALILEGGYFLDSIARDAEWVVRALLNENVPAFDRQPIRHEVATAIRRIHSSFADTYPLFLAFKEITEKISNKNVDIKDKEFLGKRTVHAPYETRGLYTPFTEEVVHGFRRQLDEAQKKAEEHEPYPNLQINVVESGEALKIDGNNIEVRSDVLGLAEYLVCLPLNPLRAPNAHKPSTVTQSAINAFSASLHSLTTHTSLASLPIFHL